MLQYHAIKRDWFGDLMKNILISKLNEKDVKHCTTDAGLWLRKKIDKPFKKLCNIFTNANIIIAENSTTQTDEEYFSGLSLDYIPPESYDISKNKNNIIVERYPDLNPNEPYIFVCNHTCPEDIETVLNVLDRNAYLILGSIESLKYNPEMYLSFLNGMIPFDIMNPAERKEVFQKMLRVLKTNSILIFPEGSHNYSPNNLINPLFDGPVNLALQTRRKIVAITMVKDQKNNVSYIDVSNPIDVQKINVDLSSIDSYDPDVIEKFYVKELSACLRDKMATAVYHMLPRHFPQVVREDYVDIEEKIRMSKIRDAFSKLKWTRDVFDAEYLVKKTKEEKEQEEVFSTLSNLAINNPSLIKVLGKDWILLNKNKLKKDVASRMREYWLSTQETPEKSLTLQKERHIT